MWYIYTMEYFTQWLKSKTKQWDLEISRKWMELEKIILSEVIQTLEDTVCTHSVDIRCKEKDNLATIYNLWEAR